MSIDAAREEISAYVDKKKRLPSKRKTIEPMIESVAEAMSFGLVTIDGEGILKQTLMEPILNSNGGISLGTIEYKRPIEAEVRKEKDKLKMGANFSHELMCYTTASTGQPKMMIDKLESSDRDICDAISTFFL